MFKKVVLEKKKNIYIYSLEDIFVLHEAVILSPRDMTSKVPNFKQKYHFL